MVKLLRYMTIFIGLLASIPYSFAGSSLHQIGGKVSGLSGTLILQNNGTDNLTLNSNGRFTFATPLAENSHYDVTILNAPANQTCTMLLGAGVVTHKSTSDIRIDCGEKWYSIMISTGANGTVTPSGKVKTPAKTAVNFMAAPNAGYEVSQWLVDGALAQTGGNSYSLNSVSGNHTVSVVFAAKAVAERTGK